MSKIEPLYLCDKYDHHINDLEYAQKDIGLLADKIDELIEAVNKLLAPSTQQKKRGL